jgi:hypothetical protein
MRSIPTLVGMAVALALAITATRADATPDEDRTGKTPSKRLARGTAPATPAPQATHTGRTPVLPAEDGPRLAPGPSPGAAPPSPGFPGSGLGLLVEPRVGGFLPSGRLGLAPSFGVQAGRILLRDKQLWAIAEIAFARPTHGGRGGTAEAPLGTFGYNLAVNDVSILLGARKMFPTRIQRLTPFAEAGLKLHVLHSTSSGRSDSQGSFGTSEETSLAPGLALRGGAAYRLGPGAVSAALELGYARVDQHITGDVWFGGLGFTAGYLYAF